MSKATEHFHAQPFHDRSHTVRFIRLQRVGVADDALQTIVRDVDERVLRDANQLLHALAEAVIELLVETTFDCCDCLDGALDVHRVFKLTAAVVHVMQTGGNDQHRKAALIVIRQLWAFDVEERPAIDGNRLHVEIVVIGVVAPAIVFFDVLPHPLNSQLLEDRAEQCFAACSCGSTGMIERSTDMRVICHVQFLVG
ncbi:hypothetical protein D3C71_1216440 [compost metagenome]